MDATRSRLGVLPHGGHGELATVGWRGSRPGRPAGERGDNLQTPTGYTRPCDSFFEF